ncbi:MAG TPA: translesion DNA synthesis-associated protein ImuA [Gammaproteobacteria bacterium]|nr:translesion DNA synthesis-associated protein ImuA [Gammaproteobacteria bacterium]
MDWDELNTRVWRGSGAAAARAVISTGFPELDSYLPGGGWPKGAITEVFVDGYGIGELALLMPAMASLTLAVPARSRKWIAWVAPPFVPYAPALQQHGVDTESLLMIHPAQGNKSRLWAVEQTVRSGSSAGVLAWITGADDVILRRLQLAAEDQQCWTVLFRPQAARQQRSPAALRIVLSRHAAVTRVQILKCRGARPRVLDIERPLLASGPRRGVAEARR